MGRLSHMQHPSQVGASCHASGSPPRYWRTAQTSICTNPTRCDIFSPLFLPELDNEPGSLGHWMPALSLPSCHARCPDLALISSQKSGAMLQHLSSLLAAPDKEVVEAALQTLVAFLRKTHGSSVRWHGSSDLNTRLLALSQGWGVKELVGHVNQCL